MFYLLYSFVPDTMIESMDIDIVTTSENIKELQMEMYRLVDEELEFLFMDSDVYINIENIDSLELKDRTLSINGNVINGNLNLFFIHISLIRTDKRIALYTIDSNGNKSHEIWRVISS